MVRDNEIYGSFLIISSEDINVLTIGRVDGLRGEIIYGNKAGKPMRIPYRKFMTEGALAGPEMEYWAEFPVGKI